MTTSRRTFIKNSSIVVAGTAIMPKNILHAYNKIPAPAIQLYSVDKEMNANAPETLKALRNIGYTSVEHAGYLSGKFYGYTSTDFRKLIHDSGLRLLSGHTVLEKRHWNNATRQFSSEWHQVIEDAATVGQAYLITPWLDASLWNNEKALKQFMDVFNQCGELCRRAGIRFGYHNHNFEFSNNMNGKTLYDVILQHTDPKLVAQQLDIGNIHPEDYPLPDLFKKYPSRFELIHVKDIIRSSIRNNMYTSTVIGKGIINLKEIIPLALHAAGGCKLILEQDMHHEQHPLDCASENFLAVKALTGFIDPGIGSKLI